MTAPKHRVRFPPRPAHAPKYRTVEMVWTADGTLVPLAEYDGPPPVKVPSTPHLYRTTDWTLHTVTTNPNGSITYTRSRGDQVLHRRTWWAAGTFPHVRKPSDRRRARHARSHR